jgi:hypothetical protein
MRPVSIVNFERLYLTAVAIGLVNSMLTWDRSVAMVSAQPGLGFGSGLVVASLVIGLLIQLLLWYFIARRASVVAKWILVILFVIGVLYWLSTLSGNPSFSGITAILGVAAVVVQAAAIWMLFRPDAKAWFSGSGATIH